MTQRRTPEVVPEGSKQYAGGPITISGPPGAGKSTVGRRVAKKMDIPFYDLDDIVAKKVGMKTTKELVEKHGRPYFWKACHLSLKETFEKKGGSYILAFGGGVTYHIEKGDMKDKNKVLTRKYAFNICLLPSSDLDELVGILWPRQEDGKRAGVKSSDHLHSYLKARMSQYTADADRVIFTYHAPIEKIVNTVLDLLD